MRIALRHFILEAGPPPLSTPPWRGSLSTARKRRKYKCFQLLSLQEWPQTYMVFCGCPAKEPRKHMGFEVFRLQKWFKNDQKHGNILSERVFSAFGGFTMAQNDGIYTGLCTFPAQNP